MRIRLRAVLVACLAGAVSACGGIVGSPDPSGAAVTDPSAGPASTRPSDPTPDPSATPAIPTCAATIKVGLVTDAGGVEDLGLDAAARDGMDDAAALAPTCFETIVATPAAADVAAAIEGLTADDADVVIGVGLLLGDALGDAADANPDRTFIAVDGVPATGHDGSWASNGLSLLFAEDQAGYLAGVLAAGVTEARHVGVVAGPVVIPPMERYVEGFLDGARSVDPAIKTEVAYVGSFADAEAGKTEARAMADAGADVIFGVGGAPGQGAIEAACAAGLAVIGVETDQYATVPALQPCIVSSAIKDVRTVVKDVLLRIARGEAVNGVRIEDASTGGVALAPFHDRAADVRADVRARLAEALSGLADGSIVPDVTIDGS